MKMNVILAGLLGGLAIAVQFSYGQANPGVQYRGAMTTGNLPKMVTRGLMEDSGVSATDVATVTNKADKVTSGTEDNLVALDSEGNLKDSGRATPDQDLRKSDSVEFAGVTSTGNSVVYETTVNSSNVTATTWYDATNQVMRITEVITAP